MDSKDRKFRLASYGTRTRPRKLGIRWPSHLWTLDLSPLVLLLSLSAVWLSVVLHACGNLTCLGIEFQVPKRSAHGSGA